MRLSKIFRPINLVRAIGLAILAGFVMLRLTDPQPIRDLRLAVFDAYQQIKPRESTPQPVTIVDIDERSLREIGQWPWARTKIGELIQKLTGNGAAVIALDAVFAEEDRLSPDWIARDNTRLPEQITEALKKLPTNDSIMADIMRNSRVVLGQTSVREVQDNSGAVREIIDTPHVVIGTNAQPDLSKYPIRNFPELVENMPALEEAASGRGLFSVEPDPDGIIRRVPLIALVKGKLRTGLAFEALRIATGSDSIAIRTSGAGIEGVNVAGQFVKSDINGKVWPYFSWPDSSRYVPAATVLNGQADPSRIAGHIILVGSSAVGLEDYRPIPLGTRVPGVEVHGQVIENILTDTLLSRGLRAILYEISAAIFAGFLIVLIAYRTGAAYAALILVVMLTIMIAGSWWSFSSQRLLFDATWPAMTLIGISVFGGIANYIREERQRQQIQGAFGQYLSPAVVDQLSENPDQLVLGGESRVLSVLFTDVRGFTTISESYRDNPQGLTKLMNEFLTVLSQPILDNNGTIDKYMGDAIMAFWNAPLEELNHAKKACQAALEMITETKTLNDRQRSEIDEAAGQTYNEINVGIGINTGMCVVGNMGSRSRFDYTALGDTVNLASRLEGQSKPYGLSIVIGEETAKEVGDTFATFEIDLIRVKGKNEPARIYCLAGDEKFASNDEFLAFRALNKTMITAYRNRQWEQAFEALEKMEDLGEKLGLTLEDYVFIYETRIAEFRANPPGANWDGVYVASSK